MSVEHPAAGDGQSATIQLSHVSKTFSARSGATVALEDLSLEVRTCDFLSVVGPSGCGKSTLLSLIGDLGGDYDGEIKVNGRSPRKARLDREYGIVFQEAALLDWRRVHENVALPLEVMNAGQRRRQGRHELVDRMLELVGLSGFEKHYPWQLSGGMKQRVAIARALVFEPDLLLMDEPFGALDEITRERMDLELLRIYEQTRTTILFITHSIAEAVFLSTRVAVMSGRPGRIVDVIEIDLPFPRIADTRQLPEYFEYVTRVRRSLTEA